MFDNMRFCVVSTCFRYSYEANVNQMEVLEVDIGILTRVSEILKVFNINCQKLRETFILYEFNQYLNNFVFRLKTPYSFN